MNSLMKRLAIALGFILSGLIISSLELHPSIKPLQIYQREIFNTNCLLLFASKDISIEQHLPPLPSRCETIDWLLPASMIASGVVVLVFGVNAYTCLLSVANLIGYLYMYCNPFIDSSFQVYAHAFEGAICIFGLIYMTLVQIRNAKQGEKAQ